MSIPSEVISLERHRVFYGEEQWQAKGIGRKGYRYGSAPTPEEAITKLRDVLKSDSVS